MFDSTNGTQILKRRKIMTLFKRESVQLQRGQLMCYNLHRFYSR